MRIDYQEQFQKLIDDYNSGSSNQERFFDELVKFSNGLEEEDRRAVIEGLTEEELALFDKLKSQNSPRKINNNSKTYQKHYYINYNQQNSSLIGERNNKQEPQSD